MSDRNMKVLVVEDNEAHAELVVDSFDEQRGHFDVVVKGTLNSAIQHINSDKPDIVIADINLPDGNGSDLVPSTKDEYAFPVIVMTALGNEEIAVETMKLGVMDYVVKSNDSFAALPHIAERAIGEWNANMQKKKAEENAARLAAAVNQAGESIMITDTDGTIQYVNPFFEKMTGFSRDAIIGENSSILSSGAEGKQFYDHLWATISSGKTWKGHFTNTRRDGSLFEEDAVISPVSDESGTIISYVAVKRDVTNERLLENQIRQSQKMAAVGQLAQKVAHDFTNALTVILGNSRLAKGCTADSPAACRYLDDVIDASNSIAELTAQLIAFAHPSNLKLRPVRLDRILQGVDRILEKSLAANIKKDLQADKNCGKVMVDPAHIEQAVVHMAINSAEAMPDGGTLTIRTGCSEPDKVIDGFEVMTITDTGCGMDDDMQEQIFDPFYSRTKSKNNSGLGLSTVYKIIEQHGGRITVESVSGQGSTFTILLPLAKNNE